MAKIFFEKVFTPCVFVQNDQRVMGIILRYVCWGNPPPPYRGLLPTPPPLPRPCAKPPPPPGTPDS